MLSVFARLEKAVPKLFPAVSAWVQRHGMRGVAALVLGVFAIRLATVSLGMVFEAAEGSPVGGDFVTFWVAAQAALTSVQLSLYNPDAFFSLLADAFPWCTENCLGLFWNYPPSYLLLLLPFNGMPIALAYVLFLVTTAALFAGSLRRAGVSGAGLIFALTSGTVLSGIVTGQNGFLTGGLLILALTTPARTPIIAGLAAGLLTVKPQLGILIPFAFAAGGHWRAFSVAATTTVALVVLSAGVFGWEAWSTFFDTLFNKWDAMANGQLNRLMVTPFAAFSTIGAPYMAAMAVQAVVSLLSIAVVALIWRRDEAHWLKAAAALAAVPLVTPHAFYYELTGPLAASALLFAHAQRTRWWPGERLVLALFWAGTCLLPLGAGVPVPLGFMLTVLPAMLALHRAELFRLSSKRTRTAEPTLAASAST